MSNKFMRLLRMIQRIPRAPDSVSTVAIAASLVALGFRCTPRTVQRDLVFLERLPLGIECCDDRKPYRWCIRGHGVLDFVRAAGAP